MHRTIIPGMFALLLAAPIAAQVPTTPRLDPRALKPDLELSVEPAAPSAVPTRFVVRNRGLRDATSASLLRVTVRRLPAVASSGEGSTSDDESLFTSLSRTVNEQRLDQACGMPLSDFQVAVDPIRAGGAFTATPPSRRNAAVGVVRLGGAVRRLAETPPGTQLLGAEMRILCVYELRAVVDAGGRIDESNERNNEVVHRFQRIATAKLELFQPSF